MLLYNLPNSLKLQITDSVVFDLFSHRQSRPDTYEAGGILLGKYYYDHIVIDGISIPSPVDKRGVFHFIRNRGRAQRIVNQEFTTSNGTSIYVGEWHTHREALPSPSTTDRTELKRAFHKSKLHFDFLIAIIVGNADELGNLWVGYQNSSALIECQLTTTHI